MQGRDPKMQVSRVQVGTRGKTATVLGVVFSEIVNAIRSADTKKA